MFRCVTLAATVLALALPAAAQAPRKFPANALRGEIVITLPPELQLNQKPARLAPGARIRGADNMLQMSGALVGRKFMVHYTLDPGGQLLDVWVLTPAEFAKKPWPVSPEQAAKWSFNPDAQIWSQP
jgi:hypothetical protein